MFQMSVSGMRPSHPAIIDRREAFLDDGVNFAVARAVVPWSSVRSGGCFPPAPR